MNININTNEQELIEIINTYDTRKYNFFYKFCYKLLKN